MMMLLRESCTLSNREMKCYTEAQIHIQIQMETEVWLLWESLRNK